MENKTVTFKRDKETKNTFRFTAEEGGDIAGSIYVKKEVAGDAQTLQVSVSVG